MGLFRKAKKCQTYLRDQHLVTGLNARCYALALLVERAGPNSQDLGLVELLDGGVRQEDARRRLGLGLDALHEDAVEERSDATDGLDGRLEVPVSSRMRQVGGSRCVVYSARVRRYSGVDEACYHARRSDGQGARD